jgi:mono/diheme cytochrome c family protein
MNTTPSAFWRCILLVALCAVGCYPEQPPPADSGGAPGAGGSTSHPQGGKAATGSAGRVQSNGGNGSTVADGGDDGAPIADAGSAGAVDYVETRQLVETCNPANSSLALPQRDGVTTNDAQTETIPISVNDLWGAFTTHCGHCHVDGALGGYHVTRDSFAAQMLVDGDENVVTKFIQSSDPNVAMPRGDEGAGPDTGIDFTTRPDGDAIKALAASLLQWIKAGLPSDVFYIPNPDYGKQSLYLMTPDVAQGQSNLGNCVPSWNFTVGWGADRHKKMQDLDDLFAKAARVPATAPGQTPTPAVKQIGLPLHLSDTDLFTYDSQELARYGVVAFAPAYPLWSDGSGKLRYVRVPLGQSIHFNKDTQEFTIPPNTRFYKTFMKEVVDRGSQAKRYRKIETRLIVSRPDNAPGDPGALFGTYVWNEDETEATLLGQDAATGDDELLRDLTPFPDKIISYYTDEPAADAIRFSDPPPRNETYALEQAGVLRHYVLPGKERCRECHMGSVRSDFVLGFTPMQISRRPVNEGGVIEDTGHDELTQLDRLSALGVITGVGSAADVNLLENSQQDSLGQPRKPRNENELIAQGYMFGNCAHCHNPGGYATNSVPELGPLLNFWPSKTGGIFQFPMDRFSPRTSRGAEGRAVPYITPSLYDLLPYGYTPSIASGRGTYTAKFFFDLADPNSADFDLAPWRSLIYRNTQSPFIYGDDLTIFPHMPLNTAGYDCRVSQILGNWMVSIPAVLVQPSAGAGTGGVGGVAGAAGVAGTMGTGGATAEVAENYWGDPTVGPTQQANVFPGDPQIDNLPQPYQEVRPLDAGYSDAVNAAAQRLQSFQQGMRYNVCPSNSDVIDVSLAPEGPIVGIPADNVDPLDGVPDHTHFVATDLTESPGPWSPRGTSWNDILVKHAFPTGTDPSLVQVEQVVSMLTDNGGVTFEQKLKSFVSTPIPFAPWQIDSNCDFTKPPLSNHLAQSYTGNSRPRWLDLAGVAPTAPIMEKLPGGNIYDMICINCHGPKMDSKGRQADTVQQLTGGASRVANFMTGLFGPLAAPGSARATPDGFGSVVTSSVTADDWGARYMSWMALGGTTAAIPKLVLNLVGRTPVAGTTRNYPLVDSSTISANMLESAKNACRLMYQFPNGVNNDTTHGNQFGVPLSYRDYLIQTNGDAELWEQLCTINNPPFVRAFVMGATGGGATFSPAIYESTAYPANTPVGKQGGQVVMSGPSGGVTDDNHVPWCISPVTDPRQQALFAKFLADNTINGQPPPVCPTALVAVPGDQLQARLNTFALRGAINAGFAVFAYLDQVSKGQASTARFDECNLVPPSP